MQLSSLALGKGVVLLTLSPVPTPLVCAGEGRDGFQNPPAPEEELAGP